MLNHKVEIGLGVIGCGGFGLFALQQFVQIQGVRLIAIAGTHREAAHAAAIRFGAIHLDSIEDLVSHPEINLVYIATPPFLHYSQAMMALKSNKHVICEKPLALSAEEADEMISYARKHNLLMTTNLMQRYNPLYEQVSKLFHLKPLGEPLHGYFENYASDEGLSCEHWFWDKAKSGGIFIEHGVHFFDMFEGWLGKGQVVSAHSSLRPESSIEEQVLCSMKYPNSVFVNYYHGFHQAGRMDRQELKLLFERGEVTLHEWVPTKLQIHAIANESDSRVLAEIFPHARLRAAATYGSKDRACTARHKKLDVYQMLHMSFGHEYFKMHVYGDLLHDLFIDQITWIYNRDHKRKITEENGYTSLVTAVTANSMINSGLQPK